MARIGRNEDKWSQEDEQLLRELWYAKPQISTRQICIRFGRSKSGITGKAHRLGLKRRDSPIKPRSAGGEAVPQLDRVEMTSLPPLASLADAGSASVPAIDLAELSATILPFDPPREFVPPRRNQCLRMFETDQPFIWRQCEGTIVRRGSYCDECRAVVYMEIRPDDRRRA